MLPRMRLELQPLDSRYTGGASMLPHGHHSPLTRGLLQPEENLV
jgi:hypothetical protein